MFPRTFQATLRQRLIVWGALLAFLCSLPLALTIIHDRKIGHFVASIDELTQSDAIRTDPSAVATRIAALEEELRHHSGYNRRNRVVMWVLIILCAGFAISFEYTWIIKPLNGLTRELAAQDERSAAIHGAALRRDEIGVLARALLAQAVAVAGKEKIAAEEVNRLNRKIEAQAALEKASAEFQHRIAGVLDSLRSGVGRMSAASDDLTKLSRSVEGNVGEVAQSTQAASGHLDDIASAAENTASVMTQILEHANRTARVSSSARDAAETAMADSTALREAVALIGQVLRLIGDIATQSNLLALNSTIEAARAGESGRGFSVVAIEMKQLAQRTGQATDDVRQRLDAVNAAATRISDRVNALFASVAEADQAAADISTLIRRQDSSSQVISSGTSETAQSMRAISSRISDVARVAQDARVAADAVTSVARSFEQQSSELRGAVEAFVNSAQRIAA